MLGELERSDLRARLGGDDLSPFPSLHTIARDREVGARGCCEALANAIAADHSSAHPETSAEPPSVSPSEAPPCRTRAPPRRRRRRRCAPSTASTTRASASPWAPSPCCRTPPRAPPSCGWPRAARATSRTAWRSRRRRRRDAHSSPCGRRARESSRRRRALITVRRIGDRGARTRPFVVHTKNFAISHRGPSSRLKRRAQGERAGAAAVEASVA